MRSLRGTEAGCHRRPQVPIVRTDTYPLTLIRMTIASSSCQKPASFHTRFVRDTYSECSFIASTIFR